MATAEHLAFSIVQERRGVHVLLWDEKEDLVHALLVLLAALPEDLSVYADLLSPDQRGIDRMQSLALSRKTPDEDSDSPPQSIDFGQHLWILFLPQAQNESLARCLNGWRKPMAESPGTLLIIRHGDFMRFQREAPDLASFFQVKTWDASSLLSIWTPRISANLSKSLPENFRRIVDELPGEPAPTTQEIELWIASNSSNEE